MDVHVGGDSLRVTTDNQPNRQKRENEMENINAILRWMKSRSTASNIQARAAEKEIATLREAGDKMAERLRDNRSASAMANSTIQKVLLFSQKDSDALAEWEAANK